MGRGSPLQVATARTEPPVFAHRGLTPLGRSVRLPALPPVRPHAERGTDGRERQSAAASTLRSQGRTVLLHWRRRPVRNGGAQGSRWRIGAPTGRRNGEVLQGGTCVPTLRPLLAVTGPPRQSGRSPVLWPLAGLQRPRPVHLCRSSSRDRRPPTCLGGLAVSLVRYRRQTGGCAQPPLAIESDSPPRRGLESRARRHGTGLRDHGPR